MTGIRSWIGWPNGYLKAHKWTTPEGQEWSRIGCVANRMQFLNPKGRADRGNPERQRSRSSWLAPTLGT